MAPRGLFVMTSCNLTEWTPSRQFEKLLKNMHSLFEPGDSKWETFSSFLVELNVDAAIIPCQISLFCKGQSTQSPGLRTAASTCVDRKPQTSVAFWKLMEAVTILMRFVRHQLLNLTWALHYHADTPLNLPHLIIIRRAVLISCISH